MDLCRLLDIQKGVTALIGGGGKSTLLRLLGQELSCCGTAIVCTTTKIYPEKALSCLASPTEEEICSALRKTPVLCIGSSTEEGKFCAPELPIEALCQLADYVIVEADGARKKPLKAHASHEPVIPSCTNQTILVVGASGFGKTANESVHRPEIYCEKLLIPGNAVVSPQLHAKFVELEALHTKVFVNQVDTEADFLQAKAFGSGIASACCVGSCRKGWYECLF